MNNEDHFHGMGPNLSKPVVDRDWSQFARGATDHRSRLTEHIEGAGFVSISDAIHVMFAQQPEAFSEAFLAFFDA